MHREKLLDWSMRILSKNGYLFTIENYFHRFSFDEKCFCVKFHFHSFETIQFSSSEIRVESLNEKVCKLLWQCSHVKLLNWCNIWASDSKLFSNILSRIYCHSPLCVVVQINANLAKIWYGFDGDIPDLLTL